MKKKKFWRIIIIFLITFGGLSLVESQSLPVQAKTVKKTKNKHRRHHRRHRRFTEKEDRFTITDSTHLNLKPIKKYQLKGLYSRVVQKSYLKQKDLYTLQVNLNTISVRKGKVHAGKVSFPSHKKAMEVINGGHTQTWENAGNDHWLVGTTPKQDKNNSNFLWTTEIARVKFKSAHYAHHQFTRLTDLHAASDDTNYHKEQLQRVEATVSPNQRYLLISSIQAPAGKNKLQTIHFGLYDLSEVNQALDQAEKNGDKKVSLTQIKALDCFHIPNIFGKNGKINSVQGVAIANDKTIYLSSEHLPLMKGHYYRTSFPREIIKIPWKNTQPHQWTYAKLNHPSWNKVATELEGMQLTEKGLYLTVAFHNPKNYLVFKNIIYFVPKI